MGAVAVYNLIAGKRSPSYRIRTLTFGKAVLITILRAPLDFFGGVGAGFFFYSIGLRTGAEELPLKIWSYIMTYIIVIINLTGLLVLFTRTKLLRALFASILYSLWLPALIVLLLSSLTLMGWIVNWVS